MGLPNKVDCVASEPESAISTLQYWNYKHCQKFVIHMNSNINIYFITYTHIYNTICVYDVYVLYIHVCTCAYTYITYTILIIYTFLDRFCLYVKTFPCQCTVSLFY